MDNIRLYGLVGYPVSHSFSPAMHNAAFKKLRINAAYCLFPIDPSSFGHSFKKVLAGGAQGLNVTIPYKERVIKYVDTLSTSAQLIGAVNTVIVRSGRLFGDNTDGRGFVRAFTSQTKKTPKDKRIVMFGAGGAAKAIGFEMAREGAESLMLCDVVERKARQLASHITRYTRCKAQAFSLKNKKGMATKIKGADVLINATPCGMKAYDPPLVEKGLLHKGLVVCDVIYNPAKTRLIKDAVRHRLTAINGSGMLLYQGVLAFELWTGRKAPVAVMRRALQKQMKAHEKD
jgi:shikimate dehydrogenase